MWNGRVRGVGEVEGEGKGDKKQCNTDFKQHHPAGDRLSPTAEDCAGQLRVVLHRGQESLNTRHWSQSASKGDTDSGTYDSLNTQAKSSSLKSVLQKVTQGPEPHRRSEEVGRARQHLLHALWWEACSKLESGNLNLYRNSTRCAI